MYKNIYFSMNYELLTRKLNNRLNNDVTDIILSYLFIPKTYDELKKAVNEYYNVDCIEEMKIARKKYGKISDWIVSRITNMDNLFKNMTLINPSLSNWDVSNVESMCHMFSGCSKFNKDISRWDVSKVKNMHSMFLGCKNFNKSLNDWNVSNVRVTIKMFAACENFNGDL